MESIEARLDRLHAKLTDEDFLANRGLSNEVGLYIFAYAPKDELTVRSFLLAAAAHYDGEKNACRVQVFDLYGILIDICRERRILDRIPQMEERRGRGFILEQIQKIAPPEAYIRKMADAGHRRGDVVMISGVGKVYPYMRSHHILNNLQHIFDDVPVVMFYPGEYTGQSLTLFRCFEDENYYRAFNLI